MSESNSDSLCSLFDSLMIALISPQYFAYGRKKINELAPH